MFSTKKRGRNKEKVGEEIRNFGQNIYPSTRISHWSKISLSRSSSSFWNRKHLQFERKHKNIEAQNTLNWGQNKDNREKNHQFPTCIQILDNLGQSNLGQSWTNLGTKTLENEEYDWLGMHKQRWVPKWYTVSCYYPTFP